MERKKVDVIWLIISIVSFGLMSTSFLLMPLDRTVEIYDAMDIASGALFYSFMFIGIIGQIILAIRRKRILKSDWKQRQKERKELIGLISFFKNIPASIADVIFVISLILYVVVTDVTQGFSYGCCVCLAICIFAFCLHCIFNGKIFNYVIMRNENILKKRKETKNDKGKE